MTYTITAGDSYATHNTDDSLTEVAEGTVTVKAEQAATDAFNAGEATATITVTPALVLSSIAVTTAPTTTTYDEGDYFDPTGMVVTATYTDNSTEAVTDYTYTPDGALTTSDTEITISYTENNVTKTTTQAITVNEVHDYATLPFNWAGGTSAELLAEQGVTGNSLGDYAEANAPYRVQFNADGDYIQIKTDSQPGKVTVGVKMIGGAKTSTITVQQSADGETFTDVQELSISGAQNSIHTLETTAAFATATRYVRLYFTKGSNVGVGPITIAKPSTDPVLTVAPAVTDVESEATNGTLNVSATNFSLDDVETYEFQYFESDGSTPSEQPEWLTVSYNGTEGKISYSVTANDGEARSAYFKLVLTYDEEDIYSDIITINQDAYVAPPTPGTEEWVEVALNKLTADDVFVIVGDNGSNYAMSNDNGTTSAPAAVAVTVTGNKITSTVADNIKWNIESTTDGYIFYPDGETETWLYCINNNNGLRVGEGESNTFNVTDDYLYNIAQTRYVGIYSSQDWRSYTSINNNIAGQTFKFYKYVAQEAPRTLNAQGYATFASTNAVNFDDTEITAWAVTAVSGSTITFAQVIGNIAAETGLLLKGAAGATISPETVASGNTPAGNRLVGIVEDTPVNAYEYYGLSGQNFVKVKAGTVKAGRALLPASVVNPTSGDGEAKVFTFVFEDDATGIKTIETVSAEEAAQIFNLAGQRLQKMQKGINIVNGKKIAVK